MFPILYAIAFYLSIISAICILVCLFRIAANKFFRKSYHVGKVLVFSFIIFVLALISTYYIDNKSLATSVIDTPRDTPPTAQDFGIEKTYTYHEFVFPFELDEKAVSDSLLNGTTITVHNPTDDEYEALLISHFSTGWEVVDQKYYKDGGSTWMKYSKDESKPSVEILYKWDMNKNGFSKFEIKFVKP